MLRFFRFLLVLSLACLVSPGARAQETQKEIQLTLEQCVEIALSNNNTIAQDKYTVALAEATVDSRRNSFLPTSSVSWSTSRSISGPREGAFIDPGTGLLISTLGESSVGGSQSIGTSISIPVYNGQLIANLSASKQGLKESRMTQAANRQQVVFLVKQRYFQLLQAMKLMAVQQERVLVSEESLRRSETLYEIGSAAILVVASARSNLAGIQAALIQRENDVAIARSNLAFQMGLGTDVEIVPVEEAFEIQTSSLTYEEALEKALEHHPTLLARKYNMLEARETLKGTQYSLRHPRITANASYSWRLNKNETFNGLEDLFLKNYGYSVGLSVSLPVFNMQTTNSLKQQKLRYFQQQEQLDQAKRQRALSVKLAFLNRERYQRLIAANEAAVNAAEENSKLEEERYKFGGGTFLDRLIAQRDLFEAQTSLVQSQYNYKIELARLEFEIGVPPAAEEEE